jgi:hypothetical protein
MNYEKPILGAVNRLLPLEKFRLNSDVVIFFLPGIANLKFGYIHFRPQFSFLLVQMRLPVAKLCSSISSLINLYVPLFILSEETPGSG